LPGELVFPSFYLARRRSWGSTPFAGFLPHEVEVHFCTSGPTCPFDRVSPAPIDFRRGDPRSPGRCDQLSAVLKGRVALGRIEIWASGLTPVCGPYPRRRSHARTRQRRGPFLPWALPLAGLWTRARASTRARPRGDHQPPEACLDALFARRRGQFSLSLQRRRFLSAHGLWRTFPDPVRSASCRRTAPSPAVTAS